MDWWNGLLRIYCALWAAGAVIMLAMIVQELFHFGTDIVLDRLFEYVGIWLGFAVIAPASTLGLIVWVVKGFTGGRKQDNT